MIDYFDLGWTHGAEDKNNNRPHSPYPGWQLSREDFLKYLEGYIDGYIYG